MEGKMKERIVSLVVFMLMFIGVVFLITMLNIWLTENFVTTCLFSLIITGVFWVYLENTVE